MKINKLLLICVLFGSLCACASIATSEPVSTNNYARNQSFTASYDTVWNATVDWFADHNVIIDKIEKTSGLITARYALSVTDIYLDCGKIKASGTLGNDKLERYGSLNVTIREQEKHIFVTVNFFGEFIYITYDAWNGRPVTAKGQCVSTGSLENDVFTHIETKTR